MDDANVDFSTTDPSVVETEEEGSTTTEEGDFSVDLNPLGVGNATVYAASGDDVDQLTIQIVADEGENGGGPVNNFEFVSVSNLVEDEDNQEQRFSFTVDGDLIEGNDGEVQIDLTDAQDQGNNAEVQYNGADATVTSGSGTASIDVRDQNADVTYTPGNDGDSSGSEIEIAVSGISVGDNTVGNEYTVGFEHLETGTSVETTFGIADTAGDVTINNDIDGNVYSTGSLTIANGVVIDGNIGSDGSTTLNFQSEVEGSITSRDSVTLENEAIVGENIDARGDVTLGFQSEVEGSITSRGSVTLENEAIVGENIDAKGDVTLGFQSEVEGNITSRGSVTLENEAIVGENINSGADVTLNFQSEVGGDIFVESGDNIICGQGSTINGQPCEEYVNENY